MHRRKYIKRVGTGISITGLIGLAGCSTGHSDPGYVENYLENIGEYELTDRTGEDTVTINVGAGPDGHSFKPVYVHISPKTTIVWSWTGRGGAHNVVCDPISQLSVNSGPPRKTGQYERTFVKPHTLLYYCEPHRTDEMKGAVAVIAPNSTLEEEKDECSCGMDQEQTCSTASTGSPQTTI